jgi:hypothetical protein
VLPDGLGVQRLGVGGDEQLLPGVGQQFPGVVLEAGDVLGGEDGGDVALGVGRIDGHQRVVERHLPVVLGVEPDRRVPVGRGLDQRPEPAVFEHEQFGEVAGEPPGPKVAAVRADPFQELLEDADLASEFVVEAGLEVRVVERGAVDRRTDVGRRGKVVAGDEVDVEPLVLPGDVGVFGELLSSVREHRPPDPQAVLLQLRPREVGREPHEEVDVAVAGEPRPAGGATDLNRVRLDG